MGSVIIKTKLVAILKNGDAKKYFDWLSYKQKIEKVPWIKNLSCLICFRIYFLYKSLLVLRCCQNYNEIRLAICKLKIDGNKKSLHFMLKCILWVKETDPKPESN